MFASQNPSNVEFCYHFVQALYGLPNSAADSALQGQLRLARAFSTFLTVALSYQQLFYLTDTTLHSFLVEELLAATDSQLDPSPPPSSLRLLVAEELGMLSVIVMKKWAEDVDNFGGAAVQRLTSILTSCGGLHPNTSCSITVSAHSCLVVLLSAARQSPVVQLSTRRGKCRAKVCPPAIVSALHTGLPIVACLAIPPKRK